MIDFDAVALHPVYQTFGELAVLSIGPSSYDVVVIDNTKGVSVEDGSGFAGHGASPICRGLLGPCSQSGI
jgi:hypothetical protein